MERVRVLWTLLAMICCGTAHAGLACLERLEVTGTWEKVAGREGEFAVTPQGRLSLQTAPQVKPLAIVRREALPEGAWTINLWLVSKSRQLPRDVTLTVGVPNADPRDRLYVRVEPQLERATITVGAEHGREQALEQEYVAAGGGPIQWLRLSYTPQKLLEIRLNGMPVPWPRPPIDLPREPVTLSATAYGKVGLELASFTVEPWAPEASATATASAYRGWEPRPSRLPEAEATATLSKMRALCENANLPYGARLNALAAVALIESAQGSGLSEATVRQVPLLLAGTMERDQQTLLETMPLLIASAGAEQRAALREFCKPLLDEALSRRSSCTGSALARVGLLEPQQAALKAASSRLELRQLDWAERFGRRDPILGLPLLLALRDPQDLRGLAWLLPRLQRVAPNYGVLLAEHLMTATDLDPAQRDNALCFAAVQVAPYDMPLAINLARSIVDPETMLTALGLISPDGHLAVEAELLTRVETLLRQRVEKWRPSRTETSAARRLVKLADFLEGQGRQAEGVGALREAAAAAEAADPVDAHGLRLVMLVANRLKLPEAPQWQQRAIDAAIDADREETEPPSGSGMVYVSATSFLVQELVRQREPDRALALAKTLSRENLPTNYNNAIVAVIYWVADTDPARLPALVRDLDEEKRLSPVSVLVRKPAVARLLVADELVALVPAEKRFFARLHLAAARGERLPAQPDEAFLQLLGKGLRGSPLGRDSWTLRSASMRQLDALTPWNLQPYETTLQADPQLYTMLVLMGFARLTGVSADETWQTWAPADADLTGPNPWSVTLDRMELPTALRPSG